MLLILLTKQPEKGHKYIRYIHSLYRSKRNLSKVPTFLEGHMKLLAHGSLDVLKQKQGRLWMTCQQI